MGAPEAMRLAEIVASTAEAAFAVDQEGTVVAWNLPAACLLGYEEAAVRGRKCYEVLAGVDLFGNRFCSPQCPVRTMARRREAVRHFQLDVRLASAERRRVDVSVLVVPGEEPAELGVVHRLRPARGHRSTVAPDAGDAPGGQRGALTPRELEVLGHLADGAGTPAIADGLCISTTTVRNHIQSILRKLEAHSRLEAVSVARRQRLL